MRRCLTFQRIILIYLFVQCKQPMLLIALIAHYSSLPVRIVDVVAVHVLNEEECLLGSLAPFSLAAIHAPCHAWKKHVWKH